MTTQQIGPYPRLGYVVLTLTTKNESEAHLAAENIKTDSDFGLGGYISNTEVWKVPQETDDYTIAIAAGFEASLQQDLSAIETRVVALAGAITKVDNHHHYLEQQHAPLGEDKNHRGFLQISGEINLDAVADRIMKERSIFRDGSDNNVGVIARADIVADGSNAQSIVAPFIAYTSDTVPDMEDSIRAVVGPEATITRFTVQKHIGHPNLPQAHMGREEKHAYGQSHGNSAG